MEHFLATRLQNIKPSPTLQVTAKAASLRAAGQDVISLGAGEPDFDTPEYIKSAAINAIHTGKTKYTSVDGTIDLKQAICKKLKIENNLAYTPKQISVGCGAKQVIFNAFMATLNPGDEVIIPAPYWVSYPDMVVMCEGTPVIVICPAHDSFKLSPESLQQAITDKTKWLILNSPSNPTGAAYSKDEMYGLAQVLLAHQHVNIICDDIYEHIIFDGFEFCTIAQVEPRLYDRVLTVNGVSKAYAMTGWRIGYGAGNPSLIEAMCTIQSQITSNPCSISQAAAAIALTQKPEPFQAEVFSRRRDLVVAMLNEINGIVCQKPQGAFYVFPSCEALIGKTTTDGKKINSCLDFSNFLLEKALVAVVPGEAFGMPNFFRISYATADETLVEACKRIKSACELLID